MDDDATATIADLVREQVTPAVLDQLRSISDPAALAAAANDTTSTLTALRDTVAGIRAEAVGRMRANGMSWVQIGADLGISDVRARAIAEGRGRR